MIKSGVKAAGLQPEILLAIVEAREVFRDLGADLIITSLTEGKHMPGSLHYEGLAVDLRTRHLALSDRALAANRLRMNLGPDYDVILETDPPHIHVEFDPKE